MEIKIYISGLGRDLGIWLLKSDNTYYRNYLSIKPNFFFVIV